MTPSPGLMTHALTGMLLGGALMILAGCASLSREECIVGDWDGIGERDGAAGQVSENRFAAHVAACDGIGAAPDSDLWRQGYERGLQRYCTPQSGLRQGQAGHPYRNVCPAATEAAFLLAHDLGLGEHRRTTRIREIDRQLDRLTRRNAEIRADLGRPDADTRLRDEFQQNEAEISRLRFDLGFARLELTAIESEIRAFRAKL